MTLITRARAAVDVLAREAIKFGAVGAIAFVVDFGLFNILLAGFDGQGILTGHPKMAKVISATVATLVAWLGNRWWTFRHRRQEASGRELALFFGFNLAGMAIALLCQAISHDVLGFRSLKADNISANGVGLVLGTLFRFWAYRTFVFRGEFTPKVPVDTQTESPPLVSS